MLSQDSAILSPSTNVLLIQTFPLPLPPQALVSLGPLLLKVHRV